MAAISEYIRMIQAALSGELELAEFGRAFMGKFSSDRCAYPEPIVEVLNRVFLDSEEFEPAPELLAERKATLPEFVIDASEFRIRLKTNVEQLLAHK